MAVLECHVLQYVCKYQHKSPYSLWICTSGLSPACPPLSANGPCQLSSALQVQGWRDSGPLPGQLRFRAHVITRVSGSLTYPECLTGHKVKWNETRVSLRREDGIFKSWPVCLCLFICQLHGLHCVHCALKCLGSGCRTLTEQTLVQTNTYTVYKHNVAIVNC